MKRWFLYNNDIFIGYAPNRAKARAWVSEHQARFSFEIKESKNMLLLEFAPEYTSRKAIYQEVTQ